MRAGGSASRITTVALLCVLGGAAWAALSAFAASGPPTPSISSGPANPTNSTSASFTYTDSGSISKFQCALDSNANASFVDCGTKKPSSTSYSNLAAGSHTFYVRAVVTSGANAGISSPASYTWLIDRTPPTVSSMTALDPSPTGASSVRWTVTFSEPVTGVSSSNFTTSVTGISGNTSVTSVSGGGATYTVTANTGSSTASGSGTEKLVLSSAGSIKDLAGNGLAGTPYTGASYTVDHLAPKVQSMALAGPSPTNAGSVAWTVTFSEPVGGVATSNFALSWSGITGTPAVTGISGGPTVYTVTASTGSGAGNSGSLQLRLTSAGAIKDGVGNGLTGVPSNGPSYAIDKLAPPPPVLGQHPATYAASTSASFTFADDSDNDNDNPFADSDDVAGATLYCSLDGSAPTACTSPKSYSSLSQGQHTFQVYAVDTAGNQSATTSFTWTVDTVAPTVAFTQTPPNPDSNQSPTFKFSATDPAPGSGVAATACKLDSGSWYLCSSPQTLSNLAFGQHTFSVFAVDRAGNVSNTASYTWTIQQNNTGSPYTISAAINGSLAPGGATLPIDLIFNSPNSGNGGSGVNGTQVGSLTVSISGITDPLNHEISELNGGSGTCKTSNYTVTQFTGSYPFYIPFGISDFNGSHSTQSLGYTNTAQWPSIRMLNSGGNQDACRNATVHLSLGGHP